MEPTSKDLLARRAALKLIATGAAAPALRAGRAEAPAAPEAPPRSPSDPDLVKPVVPWPGVLSDAELKTVSALADVILPEDEHSPAASAVGVPAFFNEWVSAPYPSQQADREIIQGGLAWLNTESTKRFGVAFHAANLEQQSAICDDICHAPKALPEFRTAARFFDTFRSLALGGFYTTEAGRKDIGYIGNVPLAKFTGASPEALRHLGLPES